VNANNEAPQWPGWAHDRKYAWRLDGIESICVVSKDYLERKEPHSMKIIDSELRLFEVADVKELGRAGIFGWRPGFKGTYLRIELKLRLERQLSLTAFKDYILDFTKKHPDSYSSGISRQEFSSKVTGAKSPAELFALL